jgi:formamidopyrimidine-DNA glycosylase
MFELPEVSTLAAQINANMAGKCITEGMLGNSPHKFVWYNRTHEEFTQLTQGKTIGNAVPRGRWLCISIDPGYVLVLGECGGKILLHPAGRNLPAKYHLALRFTDDSLFTATTQMWGAMELYETGREMERQYIKDMRVTPDSSNFTLSYFNGLLDELLKGEKRSVKSLLTQDQIIPGLGNAIAQDIMFNSRLHPRHPLAELYSDQREVLFQAIVDTVRAVTTAGGRNDETDLFGNPGGYRRIMDADAVNRPCPECGGSVLKMQYLGGSCYFCPRCQL